MFLTGSVGFPATIVTSVQGLYPRCEGQMHSLEKATLGLLVKQKKKKMFRTVPHHEERRETKTFSYDFIAGICWICETVL
jgi:hypothetical protein